MDMVALPISARCRNNAPLLQLQLHTTAVPRAQFCPPYLIRSFKFFPKEGRMLSSGGCQSAICRHLQSPSCFDRITRFRASSVGEKLEKKVVVVGGGWAGFGAAHALAKLGFSTTLLDASPNPGGLSTGFRTTLGRPVEAGIKGFWWQYHNIYHLVQELGIEWPFTEWTMSSFYSPQGIQVESPVFSALPRLPTPLGSFLYTSPYFRNLSLLDRLTALPLIQALLEFDLDDKAYSAYDAMTARELFRRAGVSAKLYQDFLEPILLVTLFAPGEQLSVAELIFQPWIQHIENQGGHILGGKRVSDVIFDDSVNKITGIVAVNSTGETEVYEADAVVFAVGVQAMQRIVASSSALAERPEFSAVSNLGTIDILATRLWLDQRIILRNPSNVIAGFEPSTGATLFDLNALQTEFADDVGSVLEVDFFHANQLIPLEDDAVIDKVMKKYLTKCDSRFKTAKIVDASVLRFKSAVTLFAPGSHQHMPTTKTSFANAFMAGDWLQQGPGSHGARGLSQEKAFVTGILAANEVARSQAVTAQVKVIEVEEDEAHIALLKSGLRHIRQGAQALGVESPFI